MYFTSAATGFSTTSAGSVVSATSSALGSFYHNIHVTQSVLGARIRVAISASVSLYLLRFVELLEERQVLRIAVDRANFRVLALLLARDLLVRRKLDLKCDLALYVPLYKYKPQALEIQIHSCHQ